MLQFPPRTHKSVYQITSTELSASDNSEVTRTLQNCGSSVRK